MDRGEFHDSGLWSVLGQRVRHDGMTNIFTFHFRWGHTSLTRDQTCAPLHWEHGALTTGPPGTSLE